MIIKPNQKGANMLSRSTHNTSTNTARNTLPNTSHNALPNTSHNVLPNTSHNASPTINSPLSTSLSQNMDTMSTLLAGCDDIKNRTMFLGGDSHVEACIYYVEVAINNITIEESVIGKLIGRLMDMSPDEMYAFLKDNALGITDVKELTTIDEALMGIMIGDGVIFIDGYDKAIKIKSKGYPMLGVSAAEGEKAMRGSKEGFCDSLKANTALLRKRIRNHKFKVNERIMGSLTKTTVALAYVDSYARPEVLEEINKRLDNLENNIEFMTDSGIIEQLTEESIYSPFPQYQTTERPDRAAMALMEGRIVLFVDNSPTALILPTSYGSFFKTADDYFSRYHVATLARFIRFIAAFLAVTLPGMYVALMTYHPEIIPEKLLLTLYEARASVPFSVIIEVLVMELAFELLREAGVRVPGPMGNTIGIVGGLIIGQSAVSAGVVSPIIVIIVALTALSSFAIPSEELAGTFRILKYFLIITGYLLGLFGLIISWLFILVHLCRMNSFGFPYLSPGVSHDIFNNPKDSMIRFPMKSLNYKSIFKKRQ